MEALKNIWKKKSIRMFFLVCIWEIEENKKLMKNNEIIVESIQLVILFRTYKLVTCWEFFLLSLWVFISTILWKNGRKWKIYRNYIVEESEI